MTSIAVVVTTINPPNQAIESLKSLSAKHDAQFIIAGDTKTPDDSYTDYAGYLSIASQSKLFPKLADLLPVKHYARKNIGYLMAMSHGVQWIRETDDDNYPYDDFMQPPSLPQTIDLLSIESPWYNVYNSFADTGIWPRGFPLEFISQNEPPAITQGRSNSPIIQDLADDNPDVDAVYRLTRELPCKFIQRKPIALLPGTWCPFNSQATWFSRDAFMLMYLPSNCSFRMTDIWRSFVAQRCLWETGEGIVFRSPSVYQERNEHNLLKDFEDEIPGYVNNDKIRIALENITLGDSDMGSNLLKCYEVLSKNDWVDKKEMPLVHAWIEAVEKLTS
jgi:hypothetical protein